jgi:pimeloyl-ACP methyl ester carboxylesterase
MNLFFIILLLIILFYLVGWMYYLPTPADELQFAETDDGWQIALYRYLPHEPFQGRREPVILCHGLSSNHYSMDFDEGNSLARYLREHGFECWVVDLRGRGLSQPRSGWRKPWGWRFDDYLQHDLPAIINFVKNKSGTARVHWIGHSMGGMLMLAYLGSMEQESIQSFCTIGSPAIFTYDWYPVFLGRITKALLSIFPIFLNRFFARIIAPVFLVINSEKYGYRRGIIPRFFANGVANVSSNVLKQFLDWIETGGFFSADGKTDYQENLKNITRPYLSVVGRFDFVASPRMCRFTFDRIGSRDKNLVVLGKEAGQNQEYEHLSILLGLNAREEVFPLIREFLQHHSQA